MLGPTTQVGGFDKKRRLVRLNSEEERLTNIKITLNVAPKPYLPKTPNFFPPNPDPKKILKNMIRNPPQLFSQHNSFYHK